MEVAVKEEFDRDGFVLVKGVVPKSWASFLHNQARHEMMGRTLLYNKAEVTISDLNLRALPKEDYLWDIAEDFLGAGPHVYNARLVVKDALFRDAVFCHQDVPYHVGGINKISIFVALSRVDSANGGMIFWTGSHRLGYLGDAGELNPDVLPRECKPVCPSLELGDVVVMHSALWHASGPHMYGPDRILADIIYMPADDPAALISDDMRARMFKRSRTSRLAELQQKVDETF